jgi:hypothetical protein
LLKWVGLTVHNYYYVRRRQFCLYQGSPKLPLMLSRARANAANVGVLAPTVVKVMGSEEPGI